MSSFRVPAAVTANRLQPGDVFIRHGFRWIARRVFDDMVGNGTVARPNPRVIITADAAPSDGYEARPAFRGPMQLGFKPWEPVAHLGHEAAL